MNAVDTNILVLDSSSGFDKPRQLLARVMVAVRRGSAR